jgi:Helix-turn-helix domain
MTSPARLATSPKTFLDRDNWLRAVLAADLPDAAARVALAIGLHLRVKTGRCDPTYPTLAAESHVSERNIYRLIPLLERTGWLAVQRAGGRLRNQYTLLNPANPAKAVSGLNPAKAVSGLPMSTLPNEATNPAITESGLTLPYVGRQKAKRAKRKAEEELDSRAPHFASLGDSQAEPPQTPARAGLAEPKERGRRGRKKESAAKPQARISPAEVAERFERFWAAYPRKVAKEAARRAYDKALERGVTPAVLLAGAQRYAAERQGEPPRYTKHPATWLNGGCWEDELSGAPVIDQAGNVVAVEQPPPKRSDHPQTWAEAADELLARIGNAVIG